MRRHAASGPEEAAGRIASTFADVFKDLHSRDQQRGLMHEPASIPSGDPPVDLPGGGSIFPNAIGDGARGNGGHESVGRCAGAGAGAGDGKQGACSAHVGGGQPALDPMLIELLRRAASSAWLFFSYYVLAQIGNSAARRDEFSLAGRIILLSLILLAARHCSRNDPQPRPQRNEPHGPRPHRSDPKGFSYVSSYAEQRKENEVNKYKSRRRSEASAP